jgi:beta-glucosidase
MREVTFVDGNRPAAAARRHAAPIVAMVFATQWTTEAQDVETCRCPTIRTR